MTDDYQTFFAQYQEKLSHDFEGALLWRQLLSFRWLNSSLAARSLAEVMAERLLGPTTFGDLAQREAHGDSPRLIINTTLTTAAGGSCSPRCRPRPHATTSMPTCARPWPVGGRPPVPAGLPAAVGEAAQPHPAGARHRSVPHPVGGAVAGSASFPPLVGPITFRVGEEDLYWHTGDGGLYENQGIESLVFVFLKQLQDKTARRALIIVFDSSFPFAVGERRLSRRAQPFSLWNYDYTHIPSIMEQRASTYQALFFRSLQLEGVFPDHQTVRVVILRHTDAEWQLDLSDLPAVCRQEDPPLDSPTAVVERIAEISTRFWLASACDRQLLAAAAAKVVAQNQPEILTFLGGHASGGTAR